VKRAAKKQASRGMHCSSLISCPITSYIKLARIVWAATQHASQHTARSTLPPTCTAGVRHVIKCGE